MCWDDWLFHRRRVFAFERMFVELGLFLLHVCGICKYIVVQILEALKGDVGGWLNFFVNEFGFLIEKGSISGDDFLAV